MPLIFEHIWKQCFFIFIFLSPENRKNLKIESRKRLLSQKPRKSGQSRPVVLNLVGGTEAHQFYMRIH